MNLGKFLAFKSKSFVINYFQQIGLLVNMSPIGNQKCRLYKKLRFKINKNNTN